MTAYKCRFRSTRKNIKKNFYRPNNIIIVENEMPHGINDVNRDSSFLLIEDVRGSSLMRVVELVHDVGSRSSWVPAVRTVRDKLRANYPADKFRIEVFFPSNRSALPFASSALRLVPNQKVFQSELRRFWM